MVHATLSAAKDAIKLDLAWNEIELAKMLPGSSYSGRTKEWTVPLTWAAMIQLRNQFRESFTYGQDLIDWTWEVRQHRVDPALELRNVIEWPDDEQQDLYEFQRAGVKWMLVAQSGLLGDELGVGKTPQALVFLQVTQALPAVIICPNRVKWHWASRLPRWCPGAVPYVLDGSAGARRKILKAAAEDPMAVVIVNFEGVRAFSRLAPFGNIKLKRCKECDPRWGDGIKPSQCHVHPKELNGFGFATVIIDEAHRIGDPKTLTTRAAWAITHDESVRYRWALTGTPDNVKRLWSIMHAVQPNEYPTRSKWMDRYALVAWNAYGGQDVVGLRPDTREELYRILDPRFRRMIKSIVLPQLPPIVRKAEFSELTPAMRKSYEELEQQLFTMLPNGQSFISQNKLVSRTRLMQFAAGSVEVDKEDEDDVSTWKVKILEPSPKLDTFQEIIEDMRPGRPFVVACEYRDVVDMAAERLSKLGIRHAMIVGGVHPRAAEEACVALRSGAVQGLIFTHKAGGTGLDMSGADLMIMLQRSWSFIENVQTEGRAHRIGSEVHESVEIIDVVTRGTREERQIEVLYQKLEQFEEIARDRKQVQEQILRTPFTSEEFARLVARLDQLNAAQEKLMRNDDLEMLLQQEEL
jgi:SNF2 family DNA or RNA helicase